jgi:hypothetical protein
LTPARSASSTSPQSKNKNKSSKLPSRICTQWQRSEQTSSEEGKHNFLIVVDRYSGFPLVARLNSQTAESIIGHMEKMFFLLGRPGEIKCDNGPCFRTEFKNWAKDRDIIVNNSAPNKPKSNGWLNAPSALSSTCCLNTILITRHSCMP